jgi:hypothetical protein
VEALPMQTPVLTKTALDASSTTETIDTTMMTCRLSNVTDVEVMTEAAMSAPLDTAMNAVDTAGVATSVAAECVEVPPCSQATIIMTSTSEEEMTTIVEEMNVAAMTDVVTIAEETIAEAMTDAETIDATMEVHAAWTTLTCLHPRALEAATTAMAMTLVATAKDPTTAISRPIPATSQEAPIEAVEADLMEDMALPCVTVNKEISRLPHFTVVNLVGDVEPTMDLEVAAASTMEPQGVSTDAVACEVVAEEPTSVATSTKTNNRVSTDNLVVEMAATLALPDTAITIQMTNNDLVVVEDSAADLLAPIIKISTTMEGPLLRTRTRTVVMAASSMEVRDVPL